MFRSLKNWYRWTFKLHPWELVDSKIIHNSEGTMLRDMYVNQETGVYRTETLTKN